MTRIAILAFLFATLAACSLATEVIFENRSGHSLRDVVLSGQGFSEKIGDVEPGETVHVYVDPSGESGLAVSFIAGGVRVSHPPAGYFEGGGKYKVLAVVNPDLSAEVDGRLRGSY